MCSRNSSSFVVLFDRAKLVMDSINDPRALTIYDARVNRRLVPF